MRIRATLSLFLGAGLIALAPMPVEAQRAPDLKPAFSIEDVLSPRFAYGIVSARKADRIAWLENEEGRRNVYTATAPDFKPVRLTSFDEDDGVDLGRLQISDDGSILVFMRGHMPNRVGWVANPGHDPRGGERAAWAVRTSGGEPWKVVEAVNVTLSPDGRNLFYMKNGEVYLAPVDPGAAAREGGEEKPLFRTQGTTQHLVWSPDSRKIAFTTERRSHSFVAVYDLEKDRLTYMAPGVDRDRRPTWSPDSRRVAFLRGPGRTFGEAAQKPAGYRASNHPPGMVRASFPGGHRLEIWIADAETGEGERLWYPTRNVSLFQRITNISWEGEHLLFRLWPGEWQRYYSLSTVRPAAVPTALTHREGMPEQIATSPDGSYLYFATNHGDLDRRHIWRTPMSGGRPEQITKGTGIETYPAVLASGDRIAFLRAGADQPQAVAIVPARGGKVATITDLPANFPKQAHVTPQSVVLKAEDGLEFHNQLFLPPDLKPGEKRPALIFIHGGPRRQMLLGYHYAHFYHVAYGMNQYWANKGYIVLSINFRGGVGYGKKFYNAPRRGSRGLSEYKDLLAAAEYLRGRADVDNERIGLWGLSYGGYMTAEGLARNSDIFAAGVDLAGVHSRGNALETESVAHKSSSISQIHNWRSPVFLAHGDDDRNVNFSHTVGLVQLLRAHSIPYELLVFPDEVHVFLKHQHWIKTFKAADDFLDRALIRKEIKPRSIAATEVRTIEAAAQQ